MNPFNINMSDIDNKPKKRGRKPKNKQVKNIVKPISKNSDEEPLIAHLNINLEEIINNETENFESEQTESICIEDKNNDSIFIKDEDCILNQNSNVELKKESDVDKILNEIKELEYKLHSLQKNNKIKINKIKFDKNTKCWWCKNSFDTPSVGIPEIYFKNKFYCYGNFCSYNCALTYNIDSNDNVWKRNSLLNLLYFKTYNINRKIKAAPHWKLLKEYGGSITIDEFRKNSIVNTHDFLLLSPPLESRATIYEKCYTKLDTNNNNNMYQKLLDDSDELILKRNKPLKSSQYSLDKTLFIKKKKMKIKMNEVNNQFSI